MRNKTTISIFLILISAFAIFLSSCKKDEKEENKTSNYNINKFIYQVMKENAWYLWHQRSPEVNPEDFTDPQELLETLIYKDLDRWSFMIDEESYTKLFQQGTYYGFGFLMKYENDTTVRIAFSYKDSPAGRAGISRGHKIISVNNVPMSQIIKENLWENIFGENKAGVSIDFSSIDLNGDTLNTTLVKEEVKKNTVLHHEIIEKEGKKIAYLVFQTFIAPSIDELNNVFSYFKQENVSDLILDLRYNGGGQVQVASHLANLIAGNSANGKIFYKLQYNEMHEDKTEKSIGYFKAESNSLDINKIAFITTNSSASASEMIINGIQPHIKSAIVGKNSHGKPVGMNGFQYQDQLLFPITFKIVNSEGNGDYFNGIPVDKNCEDGLDKPFGDEDETCFKEALHYIVYGNFIAKSASKTEPSSTDPIPMKGFRREIGAF